MVAVAVPDEGAPVGVDGEDALRAADADLERADPAVVEVAGDVAGELLGDPPAAVAEDVPVALNVLEALVDDVFIKLSHLLRGGEALSAPRKPLKHVLLPAEAAHGAHDFGLSQLIALLVLL